MTEAPIKRSADEWDSFFYRLAVETAHLSKDPDRKVGAILVTPDRRQVSMGYNGFPPEVPDLPSLLQDKQFKLANMRHAEHNCLLQASFPTEGCSLYVTRFPCKECAKRVIDAQVRRVVAPKPNMMHHRWGSSWWMARQNLWNAGIEIAHVFPGLLTLIRDSGCQD